MAQPIDFTQFNFSPEEIRNINELVFDAILEAPELNYVHTMYSGVVYKKYIGFLGEGGIVGKKAQGCNPEPQSWNVPTRQLMWDPQRWGIELSICATDLEDAMTVYSMKQGTERGDLTTTDYMTIVVELLSKAIQKMLWRFLWFGDVNAKNFSDNGIITDGVDTEYFDLLDGFWKQLAGYAPGGSGQLIAIPANTADTKADQYAQMTGDLAYSTLSAMQLNAPLVLRNQSDLVYYCTQSFADAYSMYLEGKDLESTYTNLVDGIRALYFRGIPVVPLQIWDEMIQMYENNGTKLNNPHRCLLTTKSILAVGTPSDGVLTEVDVWYDKTEDLNHLRAKDAIDAKVLRDDFFMLAK